MAASSSSVSVGGGGSGRGRVWWAAAAAASVGVAVAVWWWASRRRGSDEVGEGGADGGGGGEGVGSAVAPSLSSAFAPSPALVPAAPATSVRSPAAPTMSAADDDAAAAPVRTPVDVATALERALSADVVPARLAAGDAPSVRLAHAALTTALQLSVYSALVKSLAKLQVHSRLAVHLAADDAVLQGPNIVLALQVLSNSCATADALEVLVQPACVGRIIALVRTTLDGPLATGGAPHRYGVQQEALRLMLNMCATGEGARRRAAGRRGDRNAG